MAPTPYPHESNLIGKNAITFRQERLLTIMAIILMVFSSLLPVLSTEKEAIPQLIFTEPSYSQHSAEEDLSVGGKHMGTGEYWQRNTHDITTNDWDGDGLANNVDRFPTDF